MKATGNPIRSSDSFNNGRSNLGPFPIRDAQSCFQLTTDRLGSDRILFEKPWQDPFKDLISCFKTLSSALGSD